MNLYDVLRHLARRTIVNPSDLHRALLAIDAHEDQHGPAPEVEPQEAARVTEDTTPSDPTQPPAEEPAPAEPAESAEPATSADDTSAPEQPPAGYTTHPEGEVVDPTRTASGEERARTEGDPAHPPQEEDAGPTEPAQE